MKTLLIISPYFPPSNTADMQRIRMSLPYFKENDWQCEVVMVNEKHSETPKDLLLLQNIPKDILIHKVNAFTKKITGKFGLGSLGLRSIYFYRSYVNYLLRTKKYDLIYFSTTEFAVTILGAYWKRKFKIPYVIDVQDAWHTDYYQDKPKAERPKKYWFSYRLNKYLEPKAMKSVDGLISVSQAYINDLKVRYKELKNVPNQVVTFGAFEKDFDYVKSNSQLFNLPYPTSTNHINLVYVGRGGHDMKDALTLLFKAFKQGLLDNPSHFERIRFHFIGTSYAPKGQGTPTIRPLAEKMGLANYVNEQIDRIPFYEGINALVKADALIIVGSNDPQYTASKIYPYLMAEKPLLAIFHPDSSAFNIINICGAGPVISLRDNEKAIQQAHHKLSTIHTTQLVSLNRENFEKYSASNMTKLQCELFNEVVD